ncbi:hypothetical protein V1514DRAFT_319650 [Lipomyces japonicus]|uniref:uncharacterized protein n=1 Tax=Lipomyces japonicus TaxID=56871 RepID=UPI0034CF83E4
MSTQDEDGTAAVNLSLPLAYQQTLLNDLIDEDALVILARGLGLPRIVTNLVHAYDVSGPNLVLIIGADERDIQWLGEGLSELAHLNPQSQTRTGLTVVNTELMTIERREQLYSTGGVFAVTSRILVVDMLTDIIPREKITGIVVLHAERVNAMSLESFILQLYREKNKDGFIKAFSDSPESFITGFAPLENMLKHLFIRKPALWPRFQVQVAESLEGDSQHKKRRDVVEIDVSLSPYMKDIQNAVLECIENCLRELKRSNASLLDFDDNDWAVENALHSNFDVRIRRQLDPVYHRLSYKSRSIVADLTTLRRILNCLLSYDCVSFQKMLDTVIASSLPLPGSTKQNASPWLFLDASNVLFTAARQRVYAGTSLPSDTVVGEQGDKINGITEVLEEQPKWSQLADILDEINQSMNSNWQAAPGQHDPSPTLVMCSDEQTCVQLRDYLSDRDPNRKPGDDNGKGAKRMLQCKLKDYIAWKHDFANVRRGLFFNTNNGSNKATSTAAKTDDEPEQPLFRGRAPPNKRRRVRGGSSSAAVQSRTITTSGIVIDLDEEDNSVAAKLLEEKLNQEGTPEVEQLETSFQNDYENDYYGLADMNDVIAFMPYDGDNDDFVLEELRPRFIIMYEPDAAFVRRIEVYRACNPERNLKVYFMYYGGSVEEQRYLSIVRKEKDAFSKLIRERGNMAMVLTSDLDKLATPEEMYVRKFNTRIAGGARLEVSIRPPRVIIDLREFRSKLPQILHCQGIVLVPITLTVGDYVLSPQICVERKSIPDLISSFKDGRLYTQCEIMAQYYKIMILLIEFDAEKSFSLEPFSDASIASASGSTGNDLQSKLVLLALAFPRLKIVWSSGPFQTAQIFLELKRNQEEPNPETAASIGTDVGGEGEATMYNQAALDMLRSIPGVTAVNYQNLVYDVENFQQLCQMSESEIAKSVGRESAGKIWRFLNCDLRKQQGVIQ